MTDTPSRNYTAFYHLFHSLLTLFLKAPIPPSEILEYPPNRYWNEASEALEAGGGACRSQNHQNVKM
jgi:hypothetical protein